MGRKPSAHPAGAAAEAADRARVEVVFDRPQLLTALFGQFDQNLVTIENSLGVFIAAFSIPFAGIGAFLVLGQGIAAAQAHRRIRYALSNRCAYIGQSWMKPSLEIYPILKSTSVGLEKGRRADTVWFHVRNEKDSDGDLSTTRIGFDNIADGDKVLSLIRSIQTGNA